MVARIVAAPLIGDAADHHGRLETVGGRHRPRRHEAAIAAAGDAETLGIGDPVGDTLVDAEEDVLEFGACRVADVEPGEVLAPAGIAPVVGQENRVAGGGERHRIAGIERVFCRPARTAVISTIVGSGPDGRSRGRTRALQLEPADTAPADRPDLRVAGKAVADDAAIDGGQGFQSASGLLLKWISGAAPTASRTAAKPVLSGAVERPAAKLLVPTTPSS